MLYTDIYIHYVSAILNANNDPVGGPDFVFKIVPPMSKMQGVYQSLPQAIWLPVQINNPIKLKLLSSKSYLPFGKYRVEVYSKAQVGPTPMSVVYWSVPEQPCAVYESITITNPEETLVLPLTPVEILELTPNYSYSLNGGLLTWTDTDNRPAVGEIISIKLIPYVTLDQLIEEPYYE